MHTEEFPAGIKDILSFYMFVHNKLFTLVRVERYNVL